MDALWSVCFGQGQVSVEELYDDFVAQESACAFAYLGDEIVGCIGAYRRSIRYAGREIVLGGYGGVCTREDMRGRGIGLALCQAAHRLLEQEGCDIAFLSADRELLKLYGKLGFVWLGKFTYLDAHGHAKETDDGMIAPVCSEELFRLVLEGKELHLGPELGYW